MIYTIYPCPASFSPLDSFFPLEIVKWFKLFTHVPYHFAPWIHFAPPPPPPPGNRLMIYTIYPCPASFSPLDSFFPLDSFCPLEIVKWFTWCAHVPYQFSPWIDFAPASFCPLDRTLGASASTCKMLGHMLKSWNFNLSVFFSCMLTSFSYV